MIAHIEGGTSFRSMSASPSSTACRRGARGRGLRSAAGLALLGLAFGAGAGSASAGSVGVGESPSTNVRSDNARVLNPPILFAMKGDLYTIRPDGSKLKRRTSMGSIGEAAYSPVQRRSSLNEAHWAVVTCT